VERARACSSSDGSAPGEMTRRMGSVATVSDNRCFRLSAGGERSCKPTKSTKKMHTKAIFSTYSEHLNPRATINTVEKILLVTDETENKIIV
jgi:hypothetical protein